MGMGSGTSGNRSAPDPRMEAVRKVQAHLSTFELPGQIRCSYAGATKQAGMLETHPVTDDNEFNVDVELRVAGRSGPVYARVPVPVRQGALLRPSVIFIDGQARMIAQSVFDDLRTMLTVDMSKQAQVQEPGVGSTLEQAQAYDEAGDVPNAVVMYNRYRREMRDAGRAPDPEIVKRYKYLHALMIEGSSEKADIFLADSDAKEQALKRQSAVDKSAAPPSFRGLGRGDLTWLYQQQKNPRPRAPTPPPKAVDLRVPAYKQNLKPGQRIVPKQFDDLSIFTAGGVTWQVDGVSTSAGRGEGDTYFLQAHTIDPGHPDLKHLDEFVAGDIVWTVDDIRPWVLRWGDNQYGMIAYSLRIPKALDQQVQDKTAQAQEEPGIGSTLEQAQAYDKAGDVPNACVMYNRYRFEMRDAGQPVDPQVVQRYRYLHALMMEGSPEKAEAFLSKSSVDMSKPRGQAARMSNKTAQSESEKLERLLDLGATYEADNWPGVMIGKGLQALAADRYEEGIEFLTRAYAATHSANILLYLGQAYEKVGNVQKAVDAYTQYAASHPVEEAKIHEKIRSLTKTAQSEKPDDGGRAAFEAVQLESLEEEHQSAGPNGKPLASTMTLRTLYRSGDPGRAGGFWTPDIEYARYIAPQGPFFAADLDGALVHAQSGSPSSEGLAARALDGDLAVEYEAWDWPTTEVVVLDPSILQNLRRARVRRLRPRAR